MKELSELALAPWKIEVCDGRVTVGGVEMHPVLARDLWLRLGEAIGAAERDAERDEWAHLRDHLDRAFVGAVPATARSLDGGMEIPGVLLRDGPDRAVLRIATFSLAHLRRGRRGFDGPVFACRPSAAGYDLRPLGTRVRVPETAVPELSAHQRLRLPGAQEPVAPRRPPARPPALPTMPIHVADRRADAQRDHARILAHFTGDVVRSLADLDGILPPEVLKLHLATLVELDVLTRSETGGWRLRPPGPRSTGPTMRFKRAKKPKPPKVPSLPAKPASAKPTSKPGPSRRPGRREPAPASPPLRPFRLCPNRRCGAASRTEGPCCPLCKTPYQDAR